ncbi:ABC transporter permease [Robbsia andropogonis]|uniref:Putative glutamine transport system permease protein GlnP n=1 Tax=Robbsia andropogonis TaxID=28092 RepID=A0A0F5JXJ5_9BURK|nr:amino acid ABC transporter permease [Robbsia andropogonis]KKB62425.1 ABC transporter permease [Robbsia andropogonis]MCP1120012.1 amino acid ABC transporter permease [Robbsia andropogonis]MCP1129929.1 amino acid ABC transporter permease [Robbsia andropogonis]
MWALLSRAWPLLETAIPTTLMLGASSFVLGSILGILIALARISSIAALRWLGFAYVSIFRGTPLLVQLLLIYFGLPSFGINMDPIPASITALTLFSASYLSENFRAGINAVDPGQWEAARSMGMGYWRAMSRIILPQGLRIAVPPVGSRLIALMKDTSLASTITVVEITRVADQVGAATFRYMEMFLIVGIIYWIINQVLTIIQGLVEMRFSRHMK